MTDCICWWPSYDGKMPALIEPDCPVHATSGQPPTLQPRATMTADDAPLTDVVTTDGGSLTFDTAHTAYELGKHWAANTVMDYGDGVKATYKRGVGLTIFIPDATDRVFHFERGERGVGDEVWAKWEEPT